MNHILKNTIAGLVTFPVFIALTLGIALSSGINPHFLLLPVLITNIIAAFIHPKSPALYQIPVGLVVIFFSLNVDSEIRLDEPNPASMVMLMVPGLIFSLLSFLPIKYKLIPNSTVIAVSLGIGLFIILKQIPYAFGLNSMRELGAIKTMNALQFALALLIPILAYLGKRYFSQVQNLAAAFFAISFLAFLLPIEYPLHKLNQFHVSQFMIQDWSISSLELKHALKQGFSISILMLCSFWGYFSSFSKQKISPQIDIKQSMKTLGIGNILGSFMGLMPTNFALIESTTLAENKGKHKIGSYILILLLAICVFIDLPNFHFPQFPVAGVIIYIGTRLISQAVVLIKEEKVISYLIGMLGALIIILIDYLSGFLFALIAGLVYEIFTEEKEKVN